MKLINRKSIMLLFSLLSLISLFGANTTSTQATTSKKGDLLFDKKILIELLEKEGKSKQEINEINNYFHEKGTSFNKMVSDNKTISFDLNIKDAAKDKIIPKGCSWMGARQALAGLGAYVTICWWW